MGVWRDGSKKRGPSECVSSVAHMSEFLAAAAAVLNAPEELVLRSAEAKAQALGGTADDYLAAWGGGAAAPAPAAPAQPAPVEKAPEPAVPQIPSSAVETPAAAAVAVQPEVAAPVAEEPPSPLVDPAPLQVRRRLGGRLGVTAGAVTGLVTVVALTPWLAARADLLGEEGTFAPSLMLTSTWAIGTLVVLFGLYGMIDRLGGGIGVGPASQPAGAGHRHPPHPLLHAGRGPTRGRHYRVSAVAGAPGRTPQHGDRDGGP